MPSKSSLAHRDVALGQHDAAGRQHGLAHDLVVLPGPDVVRAEAIGAGAVVAQQVLGQRNDVLVGRGTRVDDVVAALEALIVRRIPEQAVMLLEEGQDLLAGRGGVAADDVDEALLGQHPARRCGVVRVAPAWVMLHQLQPEWKGAVGVDLLRREQGAVAHRGADGPIGTSYREQQSNAKRAALAHTRTLRNKHVCVPAGSRQGHHCHRELRSALDPG